VPKFIATTIGVKRREGRSKEQEQQATAAAGAGAVVSSVVPTLDELRSQVEVEGLVPWSTRGRIKELFLMGPSFCSYL